MNIDQDPAHREDNDSTSTSELLKTFMRFARILRLRQKTVLATLVLSCLLGGCYYTFATRYFQSSAELLIIEQYRDQLSSAGNHRSSENTMATHSKIVRSPKVIQGAIERLPQKYRGDLKNKASKDWVSAISANLSTSITRKTNFIDVRYRSKQAESAAAVVQAVVNSYLEFVRQNHRSAASDQLVHLEKQRATLEAELDEKQNQLQVHRERVGHLAISSEDNVVEPMIQAAMSLNEAALEAKQKRLELQAKLDSVKESVEQGETINLGADSTAGQEMLLASLGLSSRDTRVLAEQDKRLLTAEEELRNIEPFYGPNHPRVRELQTQIININQFLANYGSNAGKILNAERRDELGSIVINKLQQDVSQAMQQERQLTSSFEEARDVASKHSADLATLENLEREKGRLESSYDAVKDQIRSVGGLQVQAPIRAIAVSEPRPEYRPVSPRLKNVVLGSIFAGFALGCLVVYVQDVLDDRFSSPEELTAQLGTPVLAMVRKLDPLPGEGVATIHTATMPNAVETESFRTLRTSLTLSPTSCERLLISSSEPGDGKTTVSANLAVAFAKAGKRTLVIDADLRKPGMTALLGLKSQHGVADLLLSDEPIAEQVGNYLHHTEVPGLDVVPAGIRRTNPAELLSTDQFVELLAWADSQYDQVLVDCPPVLAVSDAQIVGRHVDAAILVVRPEKNPRHMVIRAVESFQSTNCEVLGIVANGLTTEMGGYGYGYGYGYGHEEEAEESAATRVPATTHERPHYEVPADVQTVQYAPPVVPHSATEPAAPIRPRKAA
ncbi:polysaccharide biosynthesis tyrosine autokinase [Adhaeretor mobilis]|uniref:non-specific protein-tyrosine kinase n=1 Tax=Adhaeretor mobilis TaxID=1930276 RepID=A0A517MY49_9BACT|nr:polysaccharide biosynthesis tyrosine autokinase [Adhaeretor mobilis]QDS99811.1 Tyrosine-protein kinase YwqD [Adhaeretor mobilis]